MQKRSTWLNRLDRCFLPKREQVVFEGLRLAAWNFAYIVVSLAVSIGLSYLSKWFPKVSLIFSLTLSVSAVAVAGILYFILWVRFASHFAFFVKESRVVKTFIVSVIGVIPNFWIFFQLSKVFQLTFGWNIDDCSRFLLYWMAFLIFLITSFIMPFVSLIGIAMLQEQQNST